MIHFFQGQSSDLLALLYLNSNQAYMLELMFTQDVLSSNLALPLTYCVTGDKARARLVEAPGAEGARVLTHV